MTATMILLLIGLTFILWVWALIDLIKTPFKDRHFKTMYLIMILLFPLLGSILYFMSKRAVKGEKRTFTPNFTQ